MCKGSCTQTSQSVKAENKIGAKVGDVVTVEMSDKKVLMAAFAFYILPLVLALVGYGIYGWIGCAVGFAAPIITLKAFDKALSDKYKATVTKIGRKSL
jgi:positive regulator of sigma E activity